MNRYELGFAAISIGLTACGSSTGNSGGGGGAGGGSTSPSATSTSAAGNPTGAVTGATTSATTSTTDGSTSQTTTGASQSASSTGSGVVCGDGVCSPSESSATCCQDCTCGAPTECAIPSCGANGCSVTKIPSGTACTGGECDGNGNCAPVCGDHVCNGTETQANCCIDCGCASGSTCTNGNCVVNPFCGDGQCNGNETQATCCTDCGCSGTNVCQNNNCTCTQATLHFQNQMADNPQFCFATNSNYIQKSVGYLRINGGTLDYLPYNGYVDQTGPLGTTYSVQTQCCYIDVCGGNQTCQTPNGNYPCFCASPVTQNRSIGACGSTTIAICP